MMSMTFKRVLAVATTIGLAIIALSVVTGTLVETRGPRADRLPEVSLASPIDVGAVVAEVGSPSAPSVSSTAAPTTTAVTSLVVASGPSHGSSATVGESTRSIASVGGSVSTPSRPAVTTLPEPPTTLPSGTTRAVPTATTIPKAEESTKTKTGTHSTTTTAEDSSTTTTSDHEVVPPTVREDHETDH